MAPRADPGRPPWPERLIAELDTADRRARDLAGGLSQEELNWKPAEELWSVGQCLQHLCAANEIYLPAIASALENRPPAPVREIAPGWFGRWFIRNYIDASPGGRRARAPRKIAPAATIDPSVLDRFVRSNDAARALVRRAGAHDVNRIRFENPFVPLLRFTVGTGLEIVWRHQHRHLLQAERIRQAVAFPRRGAATRF
jgi:hypothetical protein